MSGLLKVVFEVADVDAEERLVREYVAPAFERIERRDDARWPLFNRYGQDPTVEAGEVVLSVFGDVEAVASDERPRWEELVDDGLVEEWRADDRDVRVADLDGPERFQYRTRAAASRMSLAFFEQFDELPDAVDEFEEEEYRVGWSLCLHHLVNQLGYQAEGGQEEIDLLFECLVSRLHAMAIAPGYGADAAVSKAEELAADLESLPVELRRPHDGT